MDRVRLGRALGYGARHAAKALVQAADAATATPRKRQEDSPRPAPTAPSGVPARPRSYAPPVSARDRTAQPRGAKKSVFHPIKRYSGTVLLQVAGTFFAVFAVLMAQNAWKLRDGIRQPWKSPEAQHLWLLLALACVFGWFAVSSFVRARRVERS